MMIHRHHCGVVCGEPRSLTRAARTHTHASKDSLNARFGLGLACLQPLTRLPRLAVTLSQNNVRWPVID